MPQALGALLAPLLPGLLAGGTILGIATPTFLGGALLLGGSVAYSALMRPRVASATRGSDAQQVINQAVSPRVRVYGRAKVGGTRAFYETADTGGPAGGTATVRLFQAVILASHEIDGIEQYWLGDTSVTLESSGRVATDPWASSGGGSRAYLWGHLGAPNQAADARLMQVFPGFWTSDHRLRGMAYVVGEFARPGTAEDFSNIWPQSAQTPITCTVRGLRLWDPRSGTTYWSENSGLCILDYILSSDGMAKAITDVDLGSFSAFADLCDEAVPLASGGSEPRYRLSGTVVLTEDPADVLARMLATCDGELYQTPAGKIGIRGGKWVAPTVTVEDQHILQIGEISEGADAFAAFNEIKVIYTSPFHDFQPTETTSWIDAAAQDRNGVIVEEMPLDMVPSASQARRLAKIHMAKMNPEIRGTIATNLAGLNALGEGTIRCVIPEIAVDQAFQVTSFSLKPDLSGCEIGISALSAAAYEWNPTAEEA